MREEGFFVGAIMVNVVTTEIVILIAYLVCLVLLGINYQLVLTILFVSAIIFPLAFYHHSWSIWLGFDHLIEGLSKKPKKDSAPDKKSDDEWPDEIEP